ncbi:homocysteine S-methyltransferase family protein [Victivallis sp. Marseille-Q1083]|uniref:homocysteine S-methyltransferase family protein n=1 Tax=Victivallis sp. Marseille-Q1083 TaxID=2717288 RepID=UPI00158CD073|nr:homocysteine S-methyltransferase family protein [Victivallis sp. Marseille-Q1083]
MTRQDFQALVRAKVVMLDGATGTELIKRGMGQGVSPELWAMEHFEAVADIQNCYVAAGSDIVYVPTFGGNRLKLAEFGLAERAAEINRTLAERTVENLAGRALAFGDMAPTGQFLAPFGDLEFEAAVDIYREQAAALLAGGVDGFAVETMMDIMETRAVVLAIRELCDLPILVTLTFDEAQRTLTGNDPLSSLITLQALGVDAFGCNCSTGPADMVKLLAAIKPYATIPLVAKPNAGMPKLIGGRTVFSMGPSEFAGFTPALIDAGANLIGGCCGTTPEHIAAQSAAAKTLIGQAPHRAALSAVSAPHRCCFWGDDQPFVVIGERINPTGKKALQAELRDGRMNLVRTFALEQTRLGAAVLDVNMGLSGIDEKAMMLKAIDTLLQATELPLCIDSTDPAVVEAALRRYPGRALVNSISAEQERLEVTLPIAAKYGAMFILLPLTDEGIPATAAARAAVAERIFRAAQALGYHKEDIILDALIMTVSADQRAAAVSLELIEWASRQFQVSTTCGLSNVSFGMPERNWINTAFLGMALGRGLNCAIANPSSELLMATVAAGDVLSGRDVRMRRYVERYGSAAASLPSPAMAAGAALSPEEQVFRCVLEGDEENIGRRLEEALAKQVPLSVLVDDCLIRAINQVGDWFEQKKYFLPQLIMSADAMRRGFQFLEPLLTARQSSRAAKTRFLLATVEGDIHDIGKNIVGLMLRNYGFEVIDLGKDVPAAEILAAVREHDVKLVGLSALMTTTMTRMAEVIRTVRGAGLPEVKFIIGGAVVDQAYADEIGADAYGADAMATVRWAQEVAGRAE